MEGLPRPLSDESHAALVLSLDRTSIHRGSNTISPSIVFHVSYAALWICRVFGHGKGSNPPH